MAVQTRHPLTAQAYFQLPETNLPTELINGEVIEMPSPAATHQDIVLNTGILFRQKAKEKGGRAFIAPLDVQLDDGNVVQPDVMWLAPDTRCIVTEQRLIGAPDLIVEVLSPGSLEHDRKTKFRLYQQHGVREYWVVDTTAKLVDVFTRMDDKFQLMNVYSADETFTSPLLGDILAREIFA